MENMDDKLEKQIAEILGAKDREALLALHKAAVDGEHWEEAHARLLELTLLLLERSTKIIQDARRQQEATAREIEAIEKRLANLLSGSPRD